MLHSKSHDIRLENDIYEENYTPNGRLGSFFGLLFYLILLLYTKGNKDSITINKYPKA